MKKGLLLRVLLNRAGDLKDPLLKALPKEDADAVASLSVLEKDPMPLLTQRNHTLPRIHYSWIHSYITGQDPLKQQAMIACLDDGQRVGLSRLLNIQPPAPISSPLLKKFYLNHLYPLVQIEDKLPLEYIPENPFSSLLKLSKPQLVELVDFLGVYDLAHEMKGIVATKNMKNIYTCLSPKTQQFLRICLHQKDKVKTPSLNLDKWNGDCKHLNSLLHHRGIARFGLALSGQNPDFVWYICHMLDIGRGKILQKMVRSEEIPTLTQALIVQVESAKNFLLEGK